MSVDYLFYIGKENSVGNIDFLRPNGASTLDGLCIHSGGYECKDFVDSFMREVNFSSNLFTDRFVKKIGGFYNFYKDKEYCDGYYAKLSDLISSNTECGVFSRYVTIDTYNRYMECKDSFTLEDLCYDEFVYPYVYDKLSEEDKRKYVYLKAVVYNSDFVLNTLCVVATSLLNAHHFNSSDEFYIVCVVS